eukprot:TRINITY_DN1069_c0_g1_i1.p1 TRINITY_DN1069_c0_g1~~TRINITY_DN1069_c0_g1_i1.p1  ORF type:complete len:111 (-),score=27.89 TRINITY_DN1069_c0_g1_i1:252-584(-)
MDTLSYHQDNTVSIGSEDKEITDYDDLYPGPDIENENGTEGLNENGDSQIFNARSKEEEDKEFDEFIKRSQCFEYQFYSAGGDSSIDTTDPKYSINFEEGDEIYINDQDL